MKTTRSTKGPVKKKKVPSESGTDNLPVPYKAGGKNSLTRTIKPTKKALKATDKANIRSLFGERADEMADLIEQNNRDGAVVLIYKQLMHMMVDLMPVAEKVVRQTKGYRGIYQLNMMSSQIREMLSDMQAVQDRGLLGQTLVEKHIRPAFLDIAMQLVEGTHRIQTDVLSYVPEKHHDKVKAMVRETQRNLGQFVQLQYSQVQENIIKGLT